MRLIIVTLDYPFSDGEPFCKDELKVLEKKYDEIILVSLSGHISDKPIRYLPSNSMLFVARKKRYELLVVIKSFVQLLSIRTIREMIFAKKRLVVKERIAVIIRRIFIYYYYANIFKRAMSKFRFRENDIVYSYWMAGTAYALLKLPKSVIKVTRSHRFDCFIDVGYQPFRREIIDAMTRVFAISDSGRKSIVDNLLKYTESSGDKIAVSRLGVINERTPDLEYRKTDCFTIITCSFLCAVKRIDLLIDALALSDININWIHIGDGPLRKELERKAKILEKNSMIRYEFKGYMPQEKIIEFYSKNHIDLFINCSDSEGIPVSIMEAISNGIPVIARDVGGNAEIVDSSDGILLAQDVTAKEIYNAIKEIYLLNRDEYINLRRGAYSKYFNLYNAESNYSTFYEELNKLSQT